MKSMLKDRILIWIGVIVALFTVSCGPEEGDDDGGIQPEEPNYVVSLRTQATGDETSDYFLTADDLMTGEISAAGQGEELTGWNYSAAYGGKFFALGYTLNECVAFEVEGGELVKQGKFVFERIDMVAPVDNETFIGIGAPWGGGSYDCQLQIINVNNVAIEKNVTDPIHPIIYHIDSVDTDVQLNAWPTDAYVEGNRLFVAFYPLHGASWETPVVDSAYVAVYSYPELERLHTFTDSRTSPIGYYGSQPSILEDEAGNHYTLSTSSFLAGFTNATKPSGILKINAGEEQFDENYFFNVEESGYKVLSGAYAGNGKVVARVISTTVDVDDAAFAWGAFSVTSPVLNVAVLDLNAKTVAVVEDVPMHGGQYLTPYLLEDGKVYISVNDGTEAHVYQVDAQAATAVKGAKILGNELQGIFANK